MTTPAHTLEDALQRVAQFREHHASDPALAQAIAEVHAMTETLDDRMARAWRAEQFLGTGFDAFATMGDAEQFLVQVRQRESEWIRAVFDDDAVACATRLSDLLVLSGAYWDKPAEGSAARLSQWAARSVYGPTLAQELSRRRAARD